MSEQCPRVPDQLQNLIDDDLMSLHDEWQSITFNDVKEAMPEPLETEHGRAVILDPPAGRDRDETRTLVLGLPYQQAWKPSMAIRAEFTRQAVAPDSRMASKYVSLAASLCCSGLTCCGLSSPAL